MIFYQSLSIILVAILWGATNPFIKKGSAGIEHIKADSKILQFILEIKFLVTNWKYMVPFLINQIGSVTYLILLQSTALSLIVPVTNSLTFLFTAITGRFLGEKSVSLRTGLGMLSIIIGTTFCILGNPDIK